ncbi:hypothetical protein BJX68DRAFT_154839 [Aspergillus pseudodeflectus]|uniref:Uncharacterized protein n=1 Tax=Aspergillus pseudodeflectus TaxID=176178 RepID=A0ABR4JUR0_9EURO
MTDRLLVPGESPKRGTQGEQGNLRHPGFAHTQEAPAARAHPQLISRPRHWSRIRRRPPHWFRNTTPRHRCISRPAITVEEGGISVLAGLVLQPKTVF